MGGGDIILENVAHIASAVLLKITCSSDDLAWLTPFVIHRNWYGLCYILAMEIVVVTACLLAFGGTTLLDQFTCEDCYWTSDRILALVSSICLTGFAIFLFWEQYYGDDDEDDEEKDVPESVILENAGGAKGDGDNYEMLVDDDDLKPDEKESLEEGDESSSKKFTAMRVILVSLFGSFDDVVLQASILKGGDMTWYQLMIGIGLGATCVAATCIFISRLGPVARCVQKMPVWIVIGAFAVYSFISTFA